MLAASLGSKTAGSDWGVRALRRAFLLPQLGLPRRRLGTGSFVVPEPDPRAPKRPKKATRQTNPQHPA
jgi:hypothetical protein